MAKLDDVLRVIYRVGFVGFLVGGAFGTVAGDVDVFDTPAIVVAANAIANAYQFGAVALLVGLVIGLVVSTQTSDEQATRPPPAVTGPPTD
jgi:hypothetical protein